jgi:Fe-S oxidoreductase
MESFYKQFDSCRQWEVPPCADVCPFHLDVLDFQEKMGSGRCNTAYKTFKNAVGFPDIVANLCSEYCAEVCPRKSVDASVQLNLLEKTCVAKATRKDPSAYNLPLKDELVAIIGGGMSGLSCALRLASKKYQVTIFEKTGSLGGCVNDLIGSEVVSEDIKLQFKNETFELQLNTEVKDVAELDGGNFDAIYIATGEPQKLCHCGIACPLGYDPQSRVFIGGSVANKDPLHAMAEGNDIAWAIEVYLKTGKKEYPEEKHSSRVVVDADKLIKTEPILPSDNTTSLVNIFTDNEAVAEANRCIRCQCDACCTYCDLSSFTGKWPLKMRDEIMTTVMASESMIHKTPAVRLLNMCTQCGLCDEVCPEHIQIGGMIKEARHRLHQQNKMPGAYHQFWTNDMDFSNSDYAKLCKTAPGNSKCDYAFFPGCHLGAADPDYVILPYQNLLSHDSSVGLLLRCCGVPADWAGNDEMHLKELADIKNDWEQLGKPTLIMACPSCEKHFEEYLPEIKTVSLYEHLSFYSQDNKARHSGLVPESKPYSVFDPCSARNRKCIQQSVRALAESNGILLEELPKSDKHGCCGFGGNVAVANPDFADYVGKIRSELNNNPYIVYCINCREVFQDAGKSSMHILDLLFDINCEDNPLPDFTQRRANKVILKERLLREIWSEEMSEIPESYGFKLIMSPEIRNKMNKLMLLEEDICSVIAYSLQSKRRTFNSDRNSYTCYQELGYITCWVEYRPRGEDFEIINVYKHRMKIEIEAVWNGRKTETN